MRNVSTLDLENLPSDLPDGLYRVECTIYSLHGIDQPCGVVALQVKDGKALVVISTKPGTDTAIEYLEVSLRKVFPNCSPSARAEYLIPEPLDGRKLITIRYPPC